jgi:hypothetical protein
MEKRPTDFGKMIAMNLLKTLIRQLEQNHSISFSSMMLPFNVFVRWSFFYPLGIFRVVF